MKKLTILLILLSFIVGCAYKKPKPRNLTYHNDVEIFCPDIGRKILIETTNRQEVIRSIEKFLHQKHSQGTREDYTVLRFDDKSSLIIKKIPPEKLITCSIVEVRPQIIKRYYQY